MTLVLLTMLSDAQAGVERFTGRWVLDAAASDPLDLPTAAPRSTSSPSAGMGRGGPSGGKGGRGGGGRGGGGAPGGGRGSGPSPEAPDASSPMQLMQLLRSSEHLDLSGSADSLTIGYQGWSALSVEVGRLRALRTDTTEILGHGDTRVRLKARWEPGELELTRALGDATLTEHYLPPQDGRLVVVYEVEPPQSGMPTLWLRREYTRAE